MKLRLLEQLRKYSEEDRTEGKYDEYMTQGHPKHDDGDFSDDDDTEKVNIHTMIYSNYIFLFVGDQFFFTDDCPYRYS